MKASWKTTVLGILAIIGAVAQCIKTGHVDWGCIAQIAGGGGLVFAADHGAVTDALKK